MPEMSDLCYLGKTRMFVCVKVRGSVALEFSLNVFTEFAETLKPCCQFCTKMPEMSDLCYLGKTRMFVCVKVRGSVALEFSLNVFTEFAEF